MKKKKLMFNHPNFAAGVYRIDDLKLDQKGKPLMYKGERVLVRWKFKPTDKGKWWTPNAPDYVLLKFPHCVWESEAQLLNFLNQREKIRLANNKRKADEHEVYLRKHGDQQELAAFHRERKKLNIYG